MTRTHWDNTYEYLKPNSFDYTIISSGAQQNVETVVNKRIHDCKIVIYWNRFEPYWDTLNTMANTP